MNRLFLVIVMSLSIPSTVLAQAASQAPHEHSHTGAEAQPVSDDIVVRVSSRVITERDILSAIDQMVAGQPLNPEEIMKRYVVHFKTAVDDLVGLALLRLEAKEAGIQIDKSNVDQAVQQAKSSFPSEEEFRKALEREGVKEADFRTHMEEELMVQQVIARATKDVAGATDAEIRKFYDDNPKYFDTPAGKRSLDESREDIKKFLDQKARQTVVRKHIDELRGPAKIEMVMKQEEWEKRHARALPGEEHGHHH